MAESTDDKTHGKIIVAEPRELEPFRWPSLGHQILNRLTGRESVAIIDATSGRQWTGTQLSEVILNVSTALVDKHDIKSGDAVCIRYPNSDWTHIVAMAVICAGAIVAASYPKDPYAEFLRLARKVQPKFLFCSREELSWKDQLEADLGHKITVVAIGRADGHEHQLDDYMRYDHTKAKCSARVPVASEDPDRHVALITSSSGSTGLPKAIPMTHYNCSRCCESFSRVNIQFAGHRFSCSSGLDYVSAKVLLFTTIELGATLVILESAEPVFFAQAIEKYKINVICMGVAAFLNLITCSELQNRDISSVKQVFPFGAKMNYLQELHAFLLRHPHIETVGLSYGSTELSIVSHAAVTPDEYLKNPDRTGKLFPGFQIKVVDRATGNLLGPNEHGILYVKGPTVIRGYYDLGQLATTGDPFVRPAGTFDDDGFITAGDIVYLDDNSEIHVIGRDGEVMWCRPLRKVLPQELEVAIGEHFAVAKVAVYGKPHKRNPSQHCPRAFIVIKQEFYKDHQIKLPEYPKGDEEEVLEFKGTNKLCSLPDEWRRSLAENIMLYTNQKVGWEKQLIGGIILVDEIPVLRSGKVDKAYLKSLELGEIEVYGERSG